MALTFPTPMFDSTRSRITRTDPRRLANKTRHAQRIHENRIQDWKTIFITTGAPFLSCQKIIIYSRRILSISLFSWKKKKKILFFSNFIVSPVFDSFLSSSARLDGHGGVARAPLSRLNRLEKMGHRETRSPCGRETA